MSSLPAGHRIRVVAGADEVAEAAAEEIRSRLGGRTHARIALAGGSTPRALYERLAAGAPEDGVGWPRFSYTWTDERCVPPDHEDSNFALARRTLLDPLRVPDERRLRIRGERPAERAAEILHRELCAWSQRAPLFDLVLLGLGGDAHVASLFPAERWPEFGALWAWASRHPDGQDRVTLTPSALRSTRTTIFLVTGESKATAVRDTLLAADPSPLVPAREVAAPPGETLWVLDRAAAASLPAEVSGR